MCLECCCDRIVSPTKGGIDGVADRLENGSVVPLDYLFEEFVVTGQRSPHELAVSLEQLSAALNIAEQEGDGARRQ